MNAKNLLPAAVLIGLGMLFLGQNLGWFDLDWRELSRLWPLLIILLGINVLLGNRSRALTVVSVVLLAVALPLALVHRVHDRMERRDFFDDDSDEQTENNDDEDTDDGEDADEAATDTTSTDLSVNGTQQFSEPMQAGLQTASFRLDGGAAHFALGGTTSQLVEARTNLVFGRYTLQKVAGTSNDANLRFTMKGDENIRLKSSDWDDEAFKNRVNVSLNPAPLWDIVAEIDAGEADLDLTPYRVSHLKLDTGVTDVDVKLGDRADLTNVEVDAGVASITLRVPRSVGCRIKNEGLSMTDFEGFEKTGKYYQTAGYEQTTKKITIDIDSGLSKLAVERY